jgi:hypothetical protein
MATLPGVVYDGRGSDGIGQTTSPEGISGTRGQFSSASIDGVSGNARSGNQLDTTIAMDAVAEVKVLLNNYQAEYGKGSGGIVNIVSKSGTEDFHGSAYYYARNEKLNANDFFENAAGNSRERYRYNTVGGTFGRPLRLPGLGKKGADPSVFAPPALAQHAVLERRADQGDRLLFFLSGAVAEAEPHAAEAEGRHLQVAATQLALVHFASCHDQRSRDGGPGVDGKNRMGL